MANASIVVTGLEELFRAFGTLPTQAVSDIEHSMRPVLRDLKGKLATYPPERPGQKYHRTEDLKKGWVNAQERYVTRHDGFDVFFENTVPYDPFVQGDQQGPYFAERWDTASAILATFEDDIQHAVEDGVDVALRRLGLR